METIRSESNNNNNNNNNKININNNVSNQITTPSNNNKILATGRSAQELSENLSFCGCGFLGIYHVGVASCFHEYAPHLSLHKVSGSSVGSLVAVAHMCGNLKLAYLTSGILRVAIDARSRWGGPFHPAFDINTILRDACQQGLPDDVHLRVNGKLHISLTRYDDWSNVIVNKFDSKEDVIQAIICSCFIPYWSGFVPPKYKGVAYVDGGLSNNLLVLDDKTITVSPFSGESVICPEDDFRNMLKINFNHTSISATGENVYRILRAFLCPPPPEVMRRLCEQGFADGVRYLSSMNMISCNRCLDTNFPYLVDDREATIITTHEENRIECAEYSYHYTSYEEIRYHLSETYLTSRRGPSTMRSRHTIDDVDEVVTTDEDCYISSSSSTMAAAAAVATTFESCDECRLRRTNATSDILPRLFRERIYEVCESFNKSLYNWFYSQKPVKVISYLVMPCCLPLDIAFTLILRYWHQFPEILFILRNLIIKSAYIVAG